MANFTKKKRVIAYWLTLTCLQFFWMQQQLYFTHAAQLKSYVLMFHKSTMMLI